MAGVNLKNKSYDEVAKGLGVLPQAGRRRFESSPHLKEDIEQYILKEINQLSKLPATDLANIPIEEFMFNSLMSKKYRKYSVTPEYQEHIRNLIHRSVQNDKPIKIVWVFGGYKLWSLKESPEVDWAELFSIIYFVNWLKPVLAVYKPGVHFDFFSDACIVPIMNNIPEEDISAYQISFEKLLNIVRPKLPSNLNITFSTVMGQYNNPEEFLKELNTNIEINTEKYSHAPLILTDQQKAAIELNVKPNAGQTAPPDWREKVQIIHDSYAQVSKRRPYYRNPDTIMLVNQPIKDSLAIGTTRTSVVKFWVGVGAIGTHKDSFIEYVLSPKQAERSGIKTVAVEVPGLNMRNFKSIRFIG